MSKSPEFDRTGWSFFPAIWYIWVNMNNCFIITQIIINVVSLMSRTIIERNVLSFMVCFALQRAGYQRKCILLESLLIICVKVTTQPSTIFTAFNWESDEGFFSQNYNRFFLLVKQKFTSQPTCS